MDWYVQDPQTKYDLKVDLDKAALHGISPADVTRTLQVGLSGASAGLLHDPQSREDIPIEVRLAQSDRSGIEDLENIKLPTASGEQIALQEVTNLQQTTIDTSVYRKNLQPVVYVTGDVAGGEESPGVRHHEDERRHRQDQTAAGLCRQAVQGHDHARAYRIACR